MDKKRPDLLKDEIDGRFAEREALDLELRGEEKEAAEKYDKAATHFAAAATERREAAEAIEPTKAWPDHAKVVAADDKKDAWSEAFEEAYEERGWLRVLAAEDLQRQATDLARAEKADDAAIAGARSASDELYKAAAADCR